jgi:uncharacterized protein YecE (DUF72 family)
VSTTANRSFFLGCAVWSFKGWVGELFPTGSRPTDFLRLYGQRLTAVEGNTTFYAVPDKKTIARWVEETPPGFKFCPKLPRDVTHQQSLQPSITGALHFLELMQGLGDRLGPIFAQLPPYYGPQQFGDLLTFLRAWPRNEAPLALEVRHPDWFKESHAASLTEALTQLGVGRVLLDTRPIYDGPDDPQVGSERRKPKLPLQRTVTAPFSLVRFISHPNREFNRSYLEEWVSNVTQWLQQGTQVYFFIHCPIEEHSPGTARLFQQLLEQHHVTVPPLPWNGIKAKPTQLSLFS